jgi:hypothetical protein
MEVEGSAYFRKGQLRPDSNWRLRLQCICLPMLTKIFFPPDFITSQLTTEKGLLEKLIVAQVVKKL